MFGVNKPESSIVPTYLTSSSPAWRQIPPSTSAPARAPAEYHRRSAAAVWSGRVGDGFKLGELFSGNAAAEPRHARVWQ